jgi:phosphoglycolate phosphatase-like HAD superfamily hydrolase
MGEARMPFRRSMLTSVTGQKPRWMTRQRKQRENVVAYMRTSSAASAGVDKDSEAWQRVAIEAFAKRSGATIVDWFYDPAASDADPIEARPGFSALLDRLESNGVRTVVVEDASRFARDLVAQELGRAPADQTWRARAHRQRR